MAVALFWVMGASRGFGGIAINSSMMAVVPKYYMGRVGNAFAFATRMLQMSLGMAVGVVAHRYSLTVAFWMIGAAYLLAFVTSVLAAIMAAVPADATSALTVPAAPRAVYEPAGGSQ